MKEEIQVGLYQHYKGDYYWVKGTSRNSDNPSEIVVVYQALYENEFGRNARWHREINSFLEPREDGSQRYRYIGPYPQAAQGIEGIMLPEEK